MDWANTRAIVQPGLSLQNVYLKKSIFKESWEILSKASISPNDNKTAQILKFRLALLLGFENELLNLRKDMEVKA